MIEYSWSVSRPDDFWNFFPTLTTVCGSSSRLVQVIFSPDFTVIFCGLKAKSLISILFALLPAAASSAKAANDKELIPQTTAAILILEMSVVIGSSGYYL